MSREVRPIGRHAHECDPVRPDRVPARPWDGTSTRRSSLVLYIYRVPGSKDLFLTQHKVQNNRPTSFDINSSIYYVRYDGWIGGLPALPSGSLDRTSSQSQQAPWRNTAQKSLAQQGLGGHHGCRMAMVSVDTLRQDIRTIATLLDPKHSSLAGESSAKTTSDNPMFIDIFSDAYETYGTDVAYSDGKAFTRRLFKPMPEQSVYQFASPWLGTVTLEPHAQFKESIRGFHLPYGCEPFEASVVSELRPNFSSYRRAIGHQAQPRLGFESDGRLEPSHSQESASRMTRIRNRSSQLSDSTKDAVEYLVATKGKGFRMSMQQPSYGLQLAKEPLGGGTGDEAKLGKLVIHAAGQDFVDLIVAANVLLFNRIYQRAMPWAHPS